MAANEFDHSRAFASIRGSVLSSVVVRAASNDQMPRGPPVPPPPPRPPRPPCWPPPAPPAPSPPPPRRPPPPKPPPPPAPPDRFCQAIIAPPHPNHHNSSLNSS